MPLTPRVAPIVAPTNTATQIDIHDAASDVVGLPSQNRGDMCIGDVASGGV